VLYVTGGFVFTETKGGVTSGPLSHVYSVEDRLLKDVKLILAPFGRKWASATRVTARTNFGGSHRDTVAEVSV